MPDFINGLMTEAAIMTHIKEYKIEVKPWMLKKSSEDFDFMLKYNNDIPMPLLIMYGVKIGETKGMVKMRLHGDIKQRITTRCMCCGRPITNKISQYFGIGPICGDHNYTNPFDTIEELDEAIAAYREKLVNTIWEGYIPKSSIIAIDDDPDTYTKIAEMELCAEVKDESRVEVVKASSFTIYARVGSPIKCTDDYSVFLKFDYNPKAVAAVKELRARYWNPDNKEWEIEYKELDELKSTLTGFTFEVTNTEILPDKVEIGDINEFKTKPMAHQIEGIQYGLNHTRWLLADDQGLGKTKQIIDLAILRKKAEGFKHCLIVCGVNSLKWNWLEEIAKHSNETGYVLGMYTMKRSGKLAVGGNSAKLDDLNQLGTGSEIDSHYFIITNVESLRDEEIAMKLKELCDKEIINMVAIDEIHRCKNLRTQQGQGMLQLQPANRIGMTGTPLMNSPLDLFAILKWLGYQRYSFRSFKEHFCYTDEWGNVTAYKNIDQLRGQLDSIMLRRTKAEVLDLPGKVYVNEYVDLTDEQKRLYNQVIDDAIEDSEIAGTISADCRLAMYLRLRQVSGGIGPFNFIKKNPKLDRLEQIVEEAIYAGTKVIVYSNWVEGIRPAIERLQKYNPVVVTGETNDADRQALVNVFQHNDACKVIIGTIGALGTGVTLTKATEVVFLDEPWNDATKEQACDRAYRIGTTSKVTIRTLISHNTYDEDVHDIVLGKKEMSDTFVEKKDLERLKV